jgi:hypothetical protein
MATAMASPAAMTAMASGQEAVKVRYVHLWVCFLELGFSFYCGIVGDLVMVGGSLNRDLG